MNNTNQNHTDNFFKQGLSSPPEFTPSEKNWKAMENLLKPEDKRRTIGWIYIASGIAAALLIFLSLWLIPQQPATEVQQAQVVKSPGTGTTAKVGAGLHSGAQNNINTNTQPADNSLAGAFSNKNTGKRVLLSDNLTRPATTFETNPQLTNGQESLNPAQYVNIQGNLSNNSFGPAGKEITTVFAKASNDMGKPKDSDSPKDSEPQPRAQDPTGKWGLSIALSPDLNSVKGIGNSAFGVSLGAGLSYKLGKAVSIGTGVYYSKKLYSADKTSYKVKEKPFATWTSYSRQIDADCRVIDIPVNLSFRLSNGKQNKLYATAGLSSYIMLSEKYNFIYNSSPVYPSTGREYTIRNQNKHILSVMNLGIAVEKPLSNQVSLVVQPYAKIPLTGIGQGETELKSFGVGFKLNYSLKKKR